MYIEHMINMRHELYGESVFTSFRSYAGKIIGLELHLQRLLGAVQKTYGLEDLTLEQFESHLIAGEELIGLASQYPNHYFRLTIMAQGDSSLQKTSFDLEDLKLVKNIEKRSFDTETEKTLKLTPSPFSQYYEPIKAGSYFQQLFFRRKAMRLGFSDVLFTQDDNILEASTSNILFFKNHQFYTPKANSILYGTTLKLFEKYCYQLDCPLSYETISLSTLDTYEAVYLLNAVEGLTAVSAIEKIKYQTKHLSPLRDNFLKFYLGER
jgi:branched-subunit amino acid aminotransferase/4-amino-4-deoxychorismate lyase